MVFHTTCDELYFYRFYENFWKSIRKYNPEADFSLNYVGSKNDKIINFCKENKIILSIEETTLKDLEQKFTRSVYRDILGYYPLCRWKSIPLVDETVIVCDVDMLAIGKIDIGFIEELLKKYQAVNITRIKPDGTHGGTLLIALSTQSMISVKLMAEAYSQSLTDEIFIGEDLDVRNFIYESLDVYHLNNKVLDLSKPKYSYNGEWFVFAKGGRGEHSLKKIERLTNHLEILKNNKFIE